MRFVDEAPIAVHAGHGGRGAVSFRREKFVPFGGPDGGDGGKGADIYLVGTAGINTLADFRYHRTFRAPNGQPGGGQDCTGAGGEDLDVAVPIGTVVVDIDTEEQLGDVIGLGQRLLVAKGGKGGWGNTKFKSSTNRTPRKAMPGLEGEKRQLRLELKVMADVGLLGLPNAGKSTLIRAVSAAKPKVADYPFTTLHPNLGVVAVGTHRSFVMADIPGLIEGAHQGHGLGDKFLRHVMRTRVLIHLIDASQIDEADPLRDWQTINRELELFDAELGEKPQIVVANKVDLPEGREKAKLLAKKLPKASRPLHVISAATTEGVQDLVYLVGRRLDTLRQQSELDRDATGAQEVYP